MTITLKAWLDIKDYSDISAAMSEIKSCTAKLANDNDSLIPDSIIWHYTNGKKDSVIEIDIVDVKKSETINGLTEEYIVWGATQITVYLINVLRQNLHVKNVLIYDDGTEEVEMFIDKAKIIGYSDFKPIIPKI